MRQMIYWWRELAEREKKIETTHKERLVVILAFRILLPYLERGRFT